MKSTTPRPARALGALLAAALCLLLVPGSAMADGAASTRNIILGGAAAAAGTLLIINHNKKVHEKYAEYDRRQAQTQSDANQAQSAYESERSAYSHEAALVSEYKKETSYQHQMIKRRDAQISSLRHSLQVAKAGRAGTSTTAFTQPSTMNAPAKSTVARANTGSAQVVSYGWGRY